MVATMSANWRWAWLGLLAAPAFSLLSSKGTLATVYAVRAIVSTALLMLLMWRAQKRGAAA